MEDDTELKDLLVQALEAKGCLAKLRAQLRANVFLALDDDDALTKNGCMLNTKIKTYTETVEGKAMFCIVREFLEFFDLGFTMSVYEPESYMGSSYKYDGKLTIMKDLGLSQLDENSEGPLLLQLIQFVQLHSNNNTINKNGLGLCSAENNSNQLNTEVKNENSVKTEISLANESNVSVSESVHMNGKSEVCIPAGLNVTFDVSNPKIITEHENSSTENGIADENKETDENFNAENEENSKRTEDDVEKNDKKTEEIVDLTVFSPTLRESKASSKPDISGEKLRMVSHKTERLKTKNNLSSSADLQVGRNRSNDPLILPSLYSREFKEKTNSKELDDEFLGGELDSLDNYEEDFMSTSEIEPSEKSDASGSKVLSNRNNKELTSDCGASEEAAKDSTISELNESL